MAETTGGADLLITGHTMPATCYLFWAGDLNKAVEHAHRVLDLYDA